jgi:hypothetical protein
MLEIPLCYKAARFLTVKRMKSETSASMASSNRHTVKWFQATLIFFPSHDKELQEILRKLYTA